MTPPRFAGARMVLLAFLIMNLAIGLTYGSFGALLLPMEAHFATNRAVVSLAISLVVLNSGLLAPVIGTLIGRFSIRGIMVVGASLATIGYVALAWAQTGAQMLLCFGLAIGPGMALLGPLPCFTLVSNWYARGQGTALGIIGMPILVMALPLIVVAAMPAVGLRGMILLLAAGYASTIPLVLAVIDRPDQIGQQAKGLDGGPAPDRPAETAVTLVQLFRSPMFLAMIVGSGLIVGAGVAKTVHLMPLLVEEGWDIGRAALLLSISGGTGVIGSLLFGWLADRFNAGYTLALSSLVQAGVWVILIAPVRFELLVLDAIAIGVCSGGFISAKGVLISRLFGGENFARVMGASGLATLPFLFGMPPLAGLLRQWTGSYAVAVAVFVAGFIVAAACLGLLGRRERRLMRDGSGPGGA